MAPIPVLTLDVDLAVLRRLRFDSRDRDYKYNRRRPTRLISLVF